MGSCNLSKSLKVISTCSDRPNVFLEVKHISRKDNLDSLKWVIDLIVVCGNESPKVVVFCRSVTLTGLVCCYLTRQLSRLKKR